MPQQLSLYVHTLIHIYIRITFGKPLWCCISQMWSWAMQVLLRSELSLGRWEGDGLGIASRVERGERRVAVPVRSGDLYCCCWCCCCCGCCCCPLSLEKKKYDWGSWRKPKHTKTNKTEKQKQNTGFTHMFFGFEWLNMPMELPWMR